MTIWKIIKIILISLVIIIVLFAAFLYSIISPEGFNRYTCVSTEGDKHTIIFSYSIDSEHYPVVTLGGVDFFNKPPEMLVSVTDTNVNLSYTQDKGKFIEERQRYELVTDTIEYNFDRRVNKLNAEGRDYNCIELSDEAYTDIFINSLRNI